MSETACRSHSCMIFCTSCNLHCSTHNLLYLYYYRYFNFNIENLLKYKILLILNLQIKIVRIRTKSICVYNLVRLY